MAKIEQLDHGVIVIQADWPGNFVCALVLGLVGLDDLQKVRVKRVGQAKVLLAAVELLCKLEEVHRDLVVEMEKLAVLADHIEDDLADFDEEQDLWQDAVLLLELLKITVGQKNQLLWGCVALLDYDLVHVRV